MPSPPPDLDTLLAGWPYAVGEVSARRSHGSDGRPVLQLRVDLGVLQMEVTGRPDGSRPDGYLTYLDALRAEAQAEDLTLGEDECLEVDREFLQYYHRRVAWLALRRFAEAVDDADHTLELMDLTADHSADADWVELHEQYRPFVLYHRTQAAALAALESGEPSAAVEAIDDGVVRIEAAMANLADDFDRGEFDEFLGKLNELRQSVRVEYELGSSDEDDGGLAARLAAAIAAEQYELAAQLRDRIASHKSQRRR